jgi:hypothetical protein
MERDVSSVLLLANGGSICGAAPNAATSAVAIRCQTSTRLRIFARLATLSLQASSLVRNGSGTIEPESRSAAPGWRRRDLGRSTSRRRDQTGASLRIGKINSMYEHPVYDDGNTPLA